MKWADGLQVATGTLDARAATLAQVHQSLEGIRAQHAGLDFGPWEGEARSAHDAFHQKVCADFAGVTDRLPPIAEALKNSAQAFRDIQTAQQSTIEMAERWHFEIDENGAIRDRGTLLNQVDPRRGLVWLKIEGSILLLLARMTTTDLFLSARLFGVDLADVVKSVMDKMGDTLRNGLDWAKDAITDGFNSMVEKFAAPFIAAKRFWEEVSHPPRWVTDLIQHGKVPQLAEVLGSVVYLGGLAGGIAANTLARRDLHLFDDGRPFYGDIKETNDYRIAGPDTVFDDMARVYDERGDNKTDFDTRPQVYVTAVGEGADRRYLVTIPGTTEQLINLDRPDHLLYGWLGGRQGADWTADIKGVGFGSSAITESVQHAIDKAVAQDQAAHPGATGKPQIVLTGHSQGGIIAGNLAASSDFTSRYQVNGVVSVGSPVETLGVPPEIPMYNYQHPGDSVPKTDLNPGPTEQNLTQIELRDVGNDPNVAHDPKIYKDNILNLPHRPSDEVLEPYYGKEGTQYKIEIGRETS